MPVIRNYQERRLHVSEFTLAELQDQAHDRKPYIGHPDNAARITQCDPANRGPYGPKPEWYGGARNLSDVREVLAQGWASGAARLADLVAEIGEVPAVKTRKRKRKLADSGADIHVDNALAGDWDRAFHSTTPVEVHGTRSVDLICNWSSHSGVDAEGLFWNGAVGLVCCELLEAAGYNVRLVACETTDLPDEGWLLASMVTVKDAGEPLRIDAVAGVMAHAGVKRTLGHGMVLAAPVQVDSSFGYPVSWKTIGVRMSECGETPAGAVLVDSCFDREAAIEEVRRVLASVQGGK